IENFTVKLIWMTTEDKLRQDYRIQDLKKLLFGTSHKEKIKARCLYMRGLFDRSIFNQLKQEENTEIRKALKEKVLGRAEKESMSSSTGQIQSPPKNKDKFQRKEL
ncbi:45355_t:CDS:2, partial [Gigaspora margarita]